MAVSQTRSLSQLLTSRNRSRSRARAIALVACVGLTGSAAVAQETTYRWWNPNGAPETGSMNDSANWEDFVKPSLHPEAMNKLVFEFPEDGSFEAFNDLRDFLSVSSIYTGPFGRDGTGLIAGLPLVLRPTPGFDKCVISSRGLDPLVLETPLAGDTGMRVAFGAVVLNPSNRHQHWLTGGIEVAAYGSLTVSSAWHLGALSNTIEVQGGLLRFDAPMTIGIPVSCTGPAYARFSTDTSGRVTISRMTAADFAIKFGPGTLQVLADGAESRCSWIISEGVLEAGTGTVEEVTVGPNTVLRLVDDLAVDVVSVNDGTLDPNGFTLEVGDGDLFGANDRVVGEGIVRATGPGWLRIGADLLGFDGTLEARGGVIRVTQPAQVNSMMTLSVPQSEDRIEFSNQSSYRVGALAGTGVIKLNSPASLHIGVGDSDGSFSGTIDGSLRKIGAGTHTLTGTFQGEGRAVYIDGGTLQLRQSAVAGLSRILIAAGGTFSPLGTVNAPMIEGAGTVALGSQTFTVGEPGDDFTFSGTLEGNPETSTFRKRGGGTFTLSGDTSGFGGFFDIIDGAVRFAGGSILPAAADLTITGGELRGYGEYSGAYWNQSVIAADSSSGVLLLSGEDQWNNGTIRAEGDGAIELAGVFLEQDFSGGGQDGRLIADGASVHLIGDDAVVVQGGSMETVGDGSFEMRGSAITLRDVDHAGHMSLGFGVDITAEDVGLVTEADHTLHVEFEPDADSADGAIRGRGTGVLGGTLRVTLPDGYSPAFGDRMTVIGGDDTGEWTIDESFDTIILPDISPWQMRVVSRPDTLQLVVTRKADVAAPFGKVDVEDIRRFFDGFGGGRPLADIAEPFGRVTIEDAIAFIEDFNTANALGR